MSNSHDQDSALQTVAPPPFTVWWSSFDYVFGYQLKMIKNFWGFTDRN